MTASQASQASVETIIWSKANFEAVTRNNAGSSFESSHYPRLNDFNTYHLLPMPKLCWFINLTTLDQSKPHNYYARSG
ncbi:hypothetical protein E6O75_ATG05874 [Venturia nashicola]|uniref:Uncharacterized protein n=1 Tax=Venturia nashicola TaxID=86259 RepID=A0A4Z1PCB0_9PEZI|nr:hypothetical protein E6O75_ATG05874 [Venturia nashicola]